MGKKPGSKTSGGKTIHQVRIIGGRWKRSPLAVLDAEGLRPTPDRVRETVFNWLTHLHDGQWAHVRCLDLFSGTGALGFEAASRGAAQVVMIESNAAAVRQLEAVSAKLQAEQVVIRRADAQTVLQAMVRANNAEISAATRFDVIFLDPPYHQDWMARMLPLCVPLLAEHGLVYAELEHALTQDQASEWLAGWQVVRADKAGMVFYHLLQRNKKAEFQA